MVEIWEWPDITFTGYGGGIGGVLGGGGGLTDRGQMFQFTLWWTVVCFGVVFGIAGLIAAIGSLREGRALMAFSLFVFVFGFGLVTALVSGSIVGFLIGSVYEIGGFIMALWIPFAWALIQTLVVVISSYAEIGLNSL
ncbi:hypothetical protein BDR26DRAFT_857695 [Obelidium mucronatum]|nr:hypothetical protein BDR26DRAFT_857695 [Obelidium mucronatum]